MIQIQRRIFPNRMNSIRVTRVQLLGRQIEFRMEISEKMGSRQRRTIVNSFLRHMRPWLEHFHKGSLHHQEKGIPDFVQDYERMDRWMKKENVEIPIQKQMIGMEIRLRRLELGYTQTELSNRARVSRTQLSGIEKGTICPRPDTLFRLRTALLLPTNPNKAEH